MFLLVEVGFNSGVRNPVGKKPGFDGWEKTGFRRLGKNRVSTVGKKPGFDRWQKTGFLEQHLRHFKRSVFGEV
jgi:hypothetical protein